MSTAKIITTIVILLLAISVMTGLGSLCAEELERAGNEGYITIVSTGAKISLVEEEVSGDNEKAFACLQEVTFAADDEICIFVNETQYPLEGRSVIITGTAQGAFSTNSGSIVATREVTVSHMSLVVTAEGDVQAEVTEKETELPTETNEISLIWSNTESVYGEDIAQVEVRTQPETDIVIEIEGVPTEGSDAGRYFLKAKTESPDYVLANETAWYTITPKEVQVVWGGTFESEYGEAISADITATAAGVEDIEIAMPEERDAGSYVLTATSGNSNYKLTNATHTYTITPKEIAVIWEGEYESEYGETPGITATAEDGIDIDVMGIPTAQSNAGKYEIRAKTDNANYTITNSTHEYVVRPKTIAAEAVSWVGEFESVYGEAPSAISAEVDGVNITIEGLPSNTDAAGTYIVTAKADNGNYVLEQMTYTYTITPKEVQVVWGGTFESEYGEAISADITATAAGVEDIEIAMPEERDAGSYVLTATSGNSNYKLTNATHTYTITPKEIAVIWEGEYESEYGETPGITATAEDGIDIDVMGIPTAQSNAGKYEIRAKTDNANYTITNSTHEYVVRPKTIAAEAVSWVGEFESVYGEAPSAISAEVDGVNITIEGLPSNTDAAGTYIVTAKADNGNYVLEQTTYTYTIMPKEIAVIWEGEYESEYGETPEVIAKTTYPEVKITIIGIPNDESPEGAYLLTAINENKNYKLVNDTKVFEVKGSALAAAIEEISTELEEAREEIETIKNEASAGFTQGEGKIVAVLVLLVIILVMIAATIIVAKKNKKDQEGERENKDMTDKIDKVGKDLQKMKSLIEQLRRERESGEETFSDKAPELSDEELKRMQGWQNLVGEAVKNIRQTLEDTENQVETVYDEANRHYTKEDIFGVIKEISQEIGKLTETIHPQPGDKYNPNTMLAGNKGDTVETTLKPGMKIGQVVLKKAAVKLQKKGGEK